MTEGSTPSRSRRREWTFLSNHAHVLVCIDRDPTIRTRDLATSVEAGYVTRTREGRRNVYAVVADAPFRHPIEANHAVGDLLSMLDHPSSFRTSSNT